MTIIEAIKVSVGDNIIVSTYALKDKVLQLLGDDRNPMDSTLLRELRRLRTQGYDVTCVDTKRSIYKVKKR